MRLLPVSLRRAQSSSADCDRHGGRCAVEMPTRSPSAARMRSSSSARGLASLAASLVGAGSSGRRFLLGADATRRGSSCLPADARRAAVHQPQWRSRTRVPRRGPRGGNGHVARANRSRADGRRRPQLDHAVQGHDEVRGRDRTRTGRRLPRRELPSGRGQPVARDVHARARARPGAGVVPVLRPRADEPAGPATRVEHRHRRADPSPALARPSRDTGAPTDAEP